MKEDKKMLLSEHLTLSNAAALSHSSELDGLRLTPHFTLSELTKTNTGIENVPNEAQVENLKRLCGWLEKLRERYNRYYVLDQTTPAPPNSGGEASGRISPPEPGESEGV